MERKKKEKKEKRTQIYRKADTSKNLLSTHRPKNAFVSFRDDEKSRELIK